MRWHFTAKRYDEAARVASWVAPYIHPRLSCSNVTIKPSLKEVFAVASDEELRAFIDEAERDMESTPEGREWLLKTRGNA